MPCCEKCWSDAFQRSYGGGKSQSECYGELLVERKNNWCTPKEQAGQYWDEVNKCDSRKLEEKPNDSN